jgi:glutathionylspermidine synthase
MEIQNIPGAYDELAARIVATGILSDPWLDGRPRFRSDPILLSPALDAELRRAAEAMAVLHDQVARRCLEEPALLDEFFHLTPFQRLMWQASAPAWHGIARADVFRTAEGLQVCELNSDTPSGEAEAVLLNQLAARPGVRDPNAAFEQRFCRMVEASAPQSGAGRRGAPKGPLTIGILYPTEIVEDLSMILLYRRWLEARGWRVALGSPFNLRTLGGQPTLFDVPCDVFLRHYKTDWWGERQSAWLDDEPFIDPEPLEGPLGVLLEGLGRGRCAVVNPFGAVISQNKLSMALLWEQIEQFAPPVQDLIRRYLPRTVRLQSIAADELSRKDDWVLKSDYGCEGAEVLIGATCSDAEWREAVWRARPERWIVQRRFAPIADAAGEVVNYGVYVICGRAAGYFTRVHRGATDYSAVTVPTFVEEEAA